jgi:hypothetical protein
MVMDPIDPKISINIPSLPEVWPQSFDTEGFFLAAFRKAWESGDVQI